MARLARLIAAIALAVLLAHAAVLELLWRQVQQASQPRVLRPMATPLFTRLLKPEPPAAVQAPLQMLASAATRIRPPRAAAPEAQPTIPAAATPTQATTAHTDDAAALPSAPDLASGLATILAPDLTPGSLPHPVATAIPAASTTTLAPTVATVTTTVTATATATAPDSWPVDTRLSYQLSGRYRGDLHGDARVQWQRRGGQYEVRVEINIGLLARVTMTSQGLATPQGLQPRAYEEQVRGKTRGVQLGAEAITFADGRAVPRPEGVQDTASQFVELAHRFATGQSALEVGQSVQFWMSRPGAVDLWTYDVVETETLYTPRLGAVQAWHLKPRPLANPRGNITAEMWFAPSLRHLPVRIRINMGDAVFVDLLVDKIEQR